MFLSWALTKKWREVLGHRKPLPCESEENKPRKKTGPLPVDGKDRCLRPWSSVPEAAANLRGRGQAVTLVPNARPATGDSWPSTAAG